ncbi:MAG TPA: hypothetical protein VD932_03180, partial [Aquabacterium sp.]|nr:hypothetical protein [Aquabacterium sp.]
VRVISGTLVQPNNPGAALRWGDTLRFEIEVDSCRWVSDERGFYAIRDRSASTFVIDGDYRSVFTPGRGFHVFGSTNNNKPWAVSSSSYDAATNRTTITVTGTVGATADGRIEVQEW